MRAAAKANPFGNLAEVQLDFLFDEAPAPVAAPVLPFPKKVSVEAVQIAVAPPKKEIERNYFRLLNQLEDLGSNEAKAAHNIKAIALLKSLKEEKRTPTADEQDVLVRYTGWGGIPQIFVEGDNCKMPQQRDALKAILTDSEMDEARASTLNAHFTPPEVIDFVWNAVKRMGFTGGKVCEPAVGTGNFIGRMPLEMRKTSDVAIVEPNAVAAGIAKALYPEALCVTSGIETAAFVPESFDLAISNVPFGDYRVFDPDFDRLKYNIHDYFFAKGLSLVRPGGLVAFITSSGTMDKRSDKVRAYISGKADLVGSFRLNSGAFHAMANTDVVADVIILRKRVIGEPAKEVEWLYLERNERVGLSYNTYFHSNPHHVAGCITQVSSQFGATLGVKSEGKAFSEYAETWLSSIPADTYRPDARNRSVIKNAGSTSLEQSTTLPVGSFVLDRGEVKITINSGMAEPVTGLGAKAMQRVKGMIAIRDTVRDQLRADRDGKDATVLRRQLNILYDGFVKLHGYLSDRGNRLCFKNDPSYPLLLSLEYFDDDDLEEPVRKADIFEKCTGATREIGSKAETISHAVALSLNVHAALNLTYMAQSMDRTEDAVKEMLIEADLAFVEPVSSALVCKDEYLSGNVRIKLAQAKQHADANSEFDRNVKALETVVPVELLPEQIEVQLGASWLAPTVIEQFIESITEQRKAVHYADATAMWSVDAGNVYGDAAATKLWGTDQLNFYQLVERMLNAADLTIHKIVEVDGKEIRKVDHEASASVGEKAEEVREAFKNWLWEDKDRSAYLCSLYNNLYNSVVNRKFDGSHLVIPGLSSAITLRDAQKDSVWRILTTGNTLLALAVGGGKTLIQIVAAMEAKRLGISAKPILVVPNHMLNQFSAEFMRAYPNANLLAASKDDLVKDRRRLMLSRIATGNWDAIVITHSSFEKLPLSEDSVQAFIDENLEEIDNAILEVDDTRLVKQLQSQKKHVEEKLQSLLNRASKDDLLTFDDLGVDLIFTDEAHLFKNLYFATKRRCAGISQSASMRAFDMYLKTRLVQTKRGYDGHGVVFATATPIANSLGEMYTMQRYLQERTLKEMKIGSFDAWANNFAREVTSIEVAPDGSGYRLHTRFARYVNVPDLMRIFKQVAEIRSKRMLALPEPKLEGGKHTIVSLRPSSSLKAFVQELVGRAEAIRNGDVPPNEDNMLCVTNDGRKAALDMRLVEEDDDSEVPTKIDACVANVVHIWRATQEQRSTQIVFCDLSTPSEVKFSVYNQMRKDLLLNGIPEQEIAFIHDFNTDLQKAQLFRMVRSGKKRIVFGSTAKLGFGTNIQDRLIAEHHLDAPWRPADVEQRDGRILRQGNMNDVVHIFRYVTEASFDAYIWQTLETKAKFIAQVMDGDTDVRVVEDVDVAALSYAEVKALASGNPIVVEKAGVDNEVAKLSLLSKSFDRRKYQLRSDIRHAESNMFDARDFIRRAEKDIAAVEKCTSAFVVDGIAYSDPKIGVLAIYDAYEALPAVCDTIIGQYRGMSINVINRVVGQQRGTAILLKSNCSYEIREFGSASGAETILRNAVAKIPEIIETKRKQIARAEANLAIYKEELDKPWEHADRLAAMLVRQAEIDKALGLMDNAAGVNLLEEESSKADVKLEELEEMEVA